jgi:hypothetical protein
MSIVFSSCFSPHFTYSFRPIQPKVYTSWIYKFARSHLVGFIEREVGLSDGLSIQNNTGTKETRTYTGPSGTQTYDISFRGPEQFRPQTVRVHSSAIMNTSAFHVDKSSMIFFKIPTAIAFPEPLEFNGMITQHF